MHTLRMFGLGSLVFALGACGGKVVLDSRASGTGGTGGTGGAATTTTTGDLVTSTGTSGGSCVNPATDCPATGTACAIPECVNGACSVENAAMGTMCSDNGGVVCDGMGDCVGCNTVADCPAQPSLCDVSTCVMGTCVEQSTPQGTPCDDSGGKVCNGGGQCVQCNSVADCPAQPTLCAKSACENSACGVVNAPSGTACNDSGGSVCNGGGKCVPCSTGTTTCCLQMCIAENMLDYDNFVGFELESCGCTGGGPCASACTAACANPSTLTGGSPCGMCLEAQFAMEASSACVVSAATKCLGSSSCNSFVTCALACP